MEKKPNIIYDVYEFQSRKNSLIKKINPCFLDVVLLDAHHCHIINKITYTVFRLIGNNVSVSY